MFCGSPSFLTGASVPAAPIRRWGRRPQHRSATTQQALTQPHTKRELCTQIGQQLLSTALEDSASLFVFVLVDLASSEPLVEYPKCLVLVPRW